MLAMPIRAGVDDHTVVVLMREPRSHRYDAPEPTHSEPQGSSVSATAASDVRTTPGEGWWRAGALQLGSLRERAGTQANGGRGLWAALL